ncbi:MAG: hypothetical protein ACYC8T_21795 [Myxococcaceae bacterium]
MARLLGEAAEGTLIIGQSSNLERRRVMLRLLCAAQRLLRRACELHGGPRYHASAAGGANCPDDGGTSGNSQAA